MAIELSTKYSALVDAKLNAEIVQKDGIVWNTKYEGDPKAGAVKVPVRGASTVTSYNKQNGASKSYADGNYITLNINKDKAVNEIIDGLDAASVPDNIIADRLDSASYGLALELNNDATAELLDKATVKGETSALTNSNIYGRVVDAATKLTKAFVPARGRVMLINPDAQSKLLKSNEFISASNLGDEVKQSGAIGQIAGFTVYVDATLPANANFICLHKEWCARVKYWVKDVHLQDLNGSGDYIGASAVQGRVAYGHLVTNSAAVVMDSAVLDGSAAIASHSATYTKDSKATSAKYRINGGAWNDYSAAVDTTAGDVIEFYGVDANGVRSGIVSAKDE